MTIEQHRSLDNLCIASFISMDDMVAQRLKMNGVWSFISFIIRAAVILLFLLTTATTFPAGPPPNEPLAPTLNCEEICSDECSYPVPAEPLRYQKDKDCEQEWFTKDRNFLIDSGPSSPNKTLPSLVLAVSPYNLTTKYCITGLEYKMTCHGTGFQFQIVYLAINNTSPPPSNYAGNQTILGNIRSSQDHRLWSLLVIPVLTIIIIIFIIYLFYIKPKLRGDETNRISYVAPTEHPQDVDQSARCLGVKE
ncbi:uncharacterized protein [Hoplias malabaricus]|uniref:uncharacterized protein isoform X2 n=1 Tax=Hoplias malabaricus TaxID=27720 RepID=UPI0034637174